MAKKQIILVKTKNEFIDGLITEVGDVIDVLDTENEDDVVMSLELHSAIRVITAFKEN